MSHFGKFLLPITVPSGGWTFSGLEGLDTISGTIPAGEYDSILELLEELEDQILQMKACTITVSSIGIVTIAIADLDSVTWASCSEDLLSLLGYVGDETLEGAGTGGAYVTGTYPHCMGWYPGLLSSPGLSLSYRESDGAGLLSDSRWLPVWKGVVNRAGNRKTSAVYPGEPLYERTLTYSWIREVELVDPDRGVRGFTNEAIALPFRWYPDRDLGTVLDPGEPGEEYYPVAFITPPEIDESGQSPDLFTVRLHLNLEPYSEEEQLIAPF